MKNKLTELDFKKYSEWSDGRCANPEAFWQSVNLRHPCTKKEYFFLLNFYNCDACAFSSAPWEADEPCEEIGHIDFAESGSFHWD